MSESSRHNCPAENIGRSFGMIADSILEGSLIGPNYCIVKDGKCSKHGRCDDHTKEFTCYLCHTANARKYPVKA